MLVCQNVSGNKRNGNEIPLYNSVLLLLDIDHMTQHSFGTSLSTRHIWCLTLAGVGRRVRSSRIPVEVGFALLTLAPFGVVQTVTHASAALS